MKRKLTRLFSILMMVMLASMGVLNTALTADQDVGRKTGGLQSFPVSADETIYKGAMVCVDADGYLVAAADTAGYKFAGVAYEKKANTSAAGYGSDGDLWCRVYTEGIFELTCTDITQAMVGEIMFVKDDDVVDETSTNYVAVGLLVEYVSATSGWVDIGQRSLGQTISRTWAVSGGQPLAVNSIFTLATVGVHKAIQGTVTYTPATSGYATSIGLAGKVALAGNFTGGTGYMWGVQGQLDLGTSRTINNASSVLAGIRGIISGTTPVLTDADEICAVYADNLCATDMEGLASGQSSLFRGHNAGGKMNNFLHMWGSNNIQNFANLEAVGGVTPMVSGGGATHGGTIKKIRILIDEVVYYLTASTSVS